MGFTLTTQVSHREPLTPCSPEKLAEFILKDLDYPLTETYLKNLTSPMLLKGIDRACLRIIKAIDSGEKITLITDHDCDGQSSCAVLVWTLKHIFKYHNFDYYISHRTQEGYGITEGLLQRVYADHSPTLIITADCGISSHDQIEILSKRGADVIVTDHHTVPEEGVPSKAYCVINPQQDGCQYPDKNIAGCFVAWLVMAAVRKTYMEQKSVKLPSMAQCLDFVTVGTIADCMDLKRSLNNRIVIKYGLKLIRRKSKPAWSALLSKYNSYPSCEFLSFKLIPLLNADGRISDALNSVKYLTSGDLIEAQHALALLVDKNEQRKLLTLQQVNFIDDTDLRPDAVVVNLSKNGHCGVHGITASRICQDHKVPVIIFSSSFKEGIISGSARSPNHISLKEILDSIDSEHPGLIEQYGGHHQAAGISLKEKNFQKFQKTFVEKVQEKKLSPQKESMQIHSLIAGDPIFKPRFWLSFENLLEPFGKEFEKPLFALESKVISYSLMGENKNHINFQIQQGKNTFKALLFFQNEPMELINCILDEDVITIGNFNYDLFLGKDSLTFYVKAFYHPRTSTLFHHDTRVLKAQIVTPQEEKMSVEVVNQ